MTHMTHMTHMYPPPHLTDVRTLLICHILQTSERSSYGTATGRHGHQTTPCRKPWCARVCRSTSRPAHPITGLPPILSLNLDMSALELKRQYGTFPCRQIRNISIKDPTLFDGLGPCFGLVLTTGSILIRYACIEADFRPMIPAPLPPFGARGMSSVRYGTWLGDLKNKQPTHTLK